MSESTLKAIEDLLDLKLDEKLDSKLSPIKETLNKHTTSLDTLLKRKKTKEDENVVSSDRFKRLEDWAQQVGDKIASNWNSKSAPASQRGYFLALSSRHDSGRRLNE